jgi:tetratricopeptide (TPR) repeat protein
MTDSSASAETRLVGDAWAQFEAIAEDSKSKSSTARAHLTIPGYRLLGEIHRGGQGVVYQAIQESTNRKIAIKVLKEGPFADATELARFEREIDVLSRINHPHVVAIHDRGLTSGHAYYVMDYIAGQSLDAHVAGADLSNEDLLKLFLKVCDAVNVAHLRGVIHRDLKPGNIRVDMEGEPRILDFGLAKLAQEAAGPSSAQGMTMTGQFVGSLPWASPEQAEARSDLIDLRTDVYSLGVILYQLLTGHFPYPVSGRVGDVIRHITHTSPARPSSVHRKIDADLELILLKCLAKEPERRYQSAGELARDVRHYLAGEPVSATSPSAAYRLRKFVRRHRGAVIAAGLITLTLIVGAAVSIAFAVKASRALGIAEVQRTLAQKSERDMRQVAQFQSALLADIDVQAMGIEFKKLFRKQVQDNLSRQFVGQWPNRRKLTLEEVSAKLAEYDQISGPVQPVDIARRVLDDFILGHDADAVNTKFADQPGVQAELLFTLGKISRILGLFEKAVTSLRRSLELRRADPACDGVVLADTLAELGTAVGMTGKNEEAERLHREALALYSARLGGGHNKSIQAMNQVAVNLSARGDYAAAEAVLREALALARQLPPEEQAALAQVLNDLAGTLLNKGDFAAAEPLAREALELRRKLLGAGAEEVSDSLNILAGILYTRRDYDTAFKLLNECLAIKRKHLGDEDVEVATIINNLGGIAWRRKDRELAKTHYSESLAMYRRILGDEHPEVAGTLNNVAMLHQMEGQLAISGPMLREVLDLRRRILEPDHADLALSIANLALQVEEEGDLPKAESLYREAVAINTRKLAPCHSSRIAAEIGLIRMLVNQGKLDEMETRLNEFYAPVKESGPDEPCFNDYVIAFVRLYDEKEKLSPGNGFAAKAAEWRATTQPSHTP